MIELNARQKLLLSQVNCGGRGLEIGPSYSPVLPKATGLNIQIADYLSETELKIKYAHAPGVDIQKIEKVDYILGDRTLGEALDENGKFDFIIASHVVEHLPDLLGFLQDCQKLLTPEGVLVLAVPDKRACFDFLVPLSSTGQVIDANAAHTRRVSVGNIFDSEINRVTLDGQWAWPLGSPGCLLANGSIAHT